MALDLGHPNLILSYVTILNLALALALTSTSGVQSS